ncbi:hypothetical protein AT248_07275 [Bartonella henselae]|nr:hypothetical protein BhenCHDE101_06445 [Bartonella henselae]PNM38844.1 hypothetical protein AL470_005700 [Bartonella henselae str. Houston-1]OLL38360.1 hypothetical protein AT244_01705 [Bartonella henselae]OLL42337.1 hypothetical protein AT237_04130 [Bartonella henselae]OLL46371.1 hypothetical protein AT242_07460 [Bartonella henselae]
MKGLLQHFELEKRMTEPACIFISIKRVVLNRFPVIPLTDAVIIVKGLLCTNGYPLKINT